MIIEMYPYYSREIIPRFPSPGNPRGRSYDIFEPRIGDPLVIGHIFEGWSQDDFSIKIPASDLDNGNPINVAYSIGPARFVSNKGLFTLRQGNLSDFVNTFADVEFKVVVNSCTVLRCLGWKVLPKEINWRLEGGEIIELFIISQNALSLEEEDFMYIDIDVYYQPQKYLLSKEGGEITTHLDGKDQIPIV